MIEPAITTPPICRVCNGEKIFMANQKIPRWNCTACTTRRVREFTERNLERVRQEKREKYALNRDAERAWHRQYYLDNRERLLAASKNHGAKNREKKKAYLRNHYRENKEQMAESVRRYLQTPKGRSVHRASTLKRRALKQGVNCEVTAEELRFFSERISECFYCKSEFSPGALTWDHILALNLKGKHSLENLVRCCKSCNSRKQDKTPDEWAAEIGWDFPRKSPLAEMTQRA